MCVWAHVTLTGDSLPVLFVKWIKVEAAVCSLSV